MIISRLAKVTPMRWFFLSLTVLLFSSISFADGTAPERVSRDQFKLADYQGQWVYLDFWASWCTPCKASFPWMNEMQQRYADHGLRVIAVNVDTERRNAEKFLRKSPAEFDVVFDPKGSLATEYKLLGMPSSFLINPAGEVVFQHQGFRQRDKALLEAEIKQRLVGTSNSGESS